MTRVGKKQDVKKSTETSLETPRLGQTISPSAEPRTSNEVLHVCGNSPSIQLSPGGAKFHVADLKQPKDCKGPLAKSTEKSSQKQQSPLIGWLKRRSVTRNKMTSQRNDMELGQGEKTLKNSRSFLRERFFTLSQRDKQAFRVQMSILFPCVFKRPSLKFVQQALGEMKEHIVTTVGHLNLVRENPALTESLAQRTLYRKELINEHGMKPSKELAPGLVPICQKNSSSHMIERKANSPTRAKKSCYQIKYRNMGEDHVQTCADQSEKFEESQQVSFDSSHRRSKDVTHTGDDPMSSFSSKQPNAPKIENTQRNWRHNLMVNSDLYSGGDNRERLWSVPQTALSSGISPVNQPVREGIRQLYCLENSPSIPEWFSNLYGKGCVLELQPTVPSDLSIRSDQVKNFLRIPLRLVIQPVNCRLLSTDEASMRFYIIVTEQEQLPTTPEPRGLPPTPVLSSDGIALYQVKDIGGFDACNEKIYSRTQLLRKHGNKSEGDNGSISEDISRDSGIPVSSSDTFFPSERKISFRHSWKWFDTSKGVKKSGVKSGWSVKRLNLRRLRSRRKQYTRGLVMEIRHGILFEGPARCVHVGQNTSWWRCWTLKTAKSKNVGLSKATRTQWYVVQSPPLCSSGELKPVTPMMQYDLDKAFPQPSTDGLQTEPKDLKNMIKGKHSFVTKLSKTQNHSYRNSSTLKGGEQKRLQDTISKGIPLGMKNIKLIKNRRRRSQACSGEGMLSERTDLRGGQNPAKTYEVGMDKMPAHTSEMFPKAEKSSTKEKGTEKSVVRKRNRAGHTGRVGDKGVSHLNKSNSSLPQQKGVSEHANAHDDDHSFVMDALDCICEGADNSSVQTLDRVGRIENDGKIEERDSLPKTEKIERSAKKCDRVKFFNPQDDSLQKLCKKNDAASFQDSTGNKSNPRASSSSLSNYSSSTATSFLMRKHRRESNDMGYQGHTEKISSNKHSLSEFIKEQWRIISEGDPQNVVTPKYTLDIPGKSDGLFKLQKHQLSPKNPHKPMEKHLLDTQNGCEDLESESQVQQLNKGDSSEESCKHRNEQAFVSDNTVIREYTRELIQKILERRRGCRSPSSEQNIKSPKSHVSFSTKDTVIEDRICTNSKKHPRPGKCRQSVASSEFEFGNPMSIFKAEQSRITCHNTVSTELLNTIDVRSISTSTKSKPDEMFEAGIQGNLSNRQLCAQEKNGVYELLSPLWELNQTWSNMSQEGTHTSSSPTPEEVLPSPPRPKRKRSTDSVEEKNDSEGEPERSGGSQKDDEATAEMPKTQKSLGKEEKTSPSRQSISTRTSSRRSSTDPATQLKQRLEKLPGGSNAPQPHSRSSRTRENSHRDQTPNRPRDLKRSCLSADLRELEGIIEAWLLSTLSKNSKRQGKPGSPCSEDENGRGSERSETSTKADSQLPRNAALRSRAKGDPKYDKSSQKDSRLREYSSEEEKALSITESDHLSLHCSCKESYTSSEEGKVLSKAKRHPRSFHCSCKKIRATNEEKKITSKTKEVPKPHQPPCKESCTGSEDETLVPRHKSSSKSFQ
ncbi:uncharacterized protein LOC101863165 [Aplysia californica]|uniref:Uncharacterized protein LOC101863165 n=1 Tax=Aplysia californica TaxID=6500 RepID=A0ABM0JEW1_APLCA|nr:uncharacterized protein LOC101863165 [Aplysia californica]